MSSSSLPPGVSGAIVARWRFRLRFAVALAALFAVAATAIAVGADESLLPPALMWLGVGALALALRSVPRAVAPDERPRMAMSALWTVLGFVLFFVLPVLVRNGAG